MPINPLYRLFRSATHRFSIGDITGLLARVSESRVRELSSRLASYIEINLPVAFERRENLGDYRTNPYVLLTSASVMRLNDPNRFANFLFNSKLYMALETSFGKSIESTFLSHYPTNNEMKWIDPPEKIEECARLEGLSREERARQRTQSVWSEIDKSCVHGTRRYLVSIKSGPNTINDSQVQAMTDAIIINHRKWAAQTQTSYSQVSHLDIVIGLTYGTDATTNNKENQILVKLLGHGFMEEDRQQHPGVLIDSSTRFVRVYRKIGIDFWAFIGNPVSPSESTHTFLEVLLALSGGLATACSGGSLESRVNGKLQALGEALRNLQFPSASLPTWVRQEFSEDTLFWFATALTAFYDEGI